jgi:hypothetical protein
LSSSSLPGYDWQIVHQPTGYVFYAALVGNAYHTLRYSVNKRAEMVSRSESNLDWNTVPLITRTSLIDQIVRWGREAKERVAGLRQGDFDSGAAEVAYASGDNSRFTVAEQYEIARQLRMVRESLEQNFELSAAKIKRVEERLDEAEEASRRLGRKDWILLFSGAVFSLILTDVITPAAAQHVFAMLIHGAGHLFTSGSGPVAGVLPG